MGVLPCRGYSARFLIDQGRVILPTVDRDCPGRPSRRSARSGLTAGYPTTANSPAAILAWSSSSEGNGRVNDWHGD